MGRRMGVRTREFRLCLAPLSHDLVRPGAPQHALAAGIVGLMEAVKQGLEIHVAVDRQHVTLKTAVEALRQAIAVRRVGPRRPVLHTQARSSSVALQGSLCGRLWATCEGSRG